jgi:hypothetical protein
VSARPSQRAWTLADLDALPAKVDIATAASVLGVGPKTLRALFDGSRTAQVQVGDREVEVAALRLSRQLWIVTDSLKRVFTSEEAP